MFRSLLAAGTLAVGLLFGATANAQTAPAAQTGSGTSLAIQTSAKCGMCRANLYKTMKFERGVSRAELNMDTKVLTVWYDPSRTNPAKLRKAVALTGYDADDVPADKKAHDRLEPCCQKTAAAHTDGPMGR